MVTISNEHLTVEIAEKGAELQSIKDANGREYLWQGDPDFWPRRSPILFPLVCSVNDDTYTVDGKDYHLPRHGFARDMNFTVVRQSAEKVTLALCDSEETLKIYPYHFMLAITYRLGGNKLHVVWHVENTDTQEIHFQIGGHPAFNVPGNKKGEKLEGTLVLDNEAPLIGLKSYGDGTHEMTEIPLTKIDKNIIHFDNEFFADDSVKIHRSQVHCASLLDTDGTAAVTVNFKTPIIAFWSPYNKEAGFVCIEPWFGVGDPRGWKGEFKDKPFMNHLLPGASFMSEYQITIK